MPEHRIIRHGTPLDYTCHNAKFETNIAKGEPHGPCPTCGSVFKKGLAAYQGGSLWLEHVREHENPDEPLYWLMHYDGSGYPVIPLSGVMSNDDLQELARLMASLVP